VSAFFIDRFDTKANQNLIAQRGPLQELNKDGRAGQLVHFLGPIF
jgi:hypothetical protein